MKKTVFVLTFLVLMVVMITAQPLPREMFAVPGDAQWVIRLDVGKFISTRVSDLLKEENGGNRVKAFSALISGMLKVNPLEDIESITIFGRGKNRDHAVVCWKGNFDKAHLLSLLDKEELNHKKIIHGKFTIHQWNGSQFGVFANDRVILTGKDEDAVKNALDALTNKRKNFQASPLRPFWDEIPGDAFLKAVADNISALVKDREASSILKKTGMAFFLAMEKNEDLSMKLKLAADSPETAQSIEQILNGFIALAKLKQDKHKNDPRFKLLEGLTLMVRQNYVNVELIIPSRELIEMVRERRGMRGI
jgi:hypothetical protein